MRNHLNLDHNKFKQAAIKAWDTVYENLEPNGFVLQFKPETKQATVVYSSIFNHVLYNLSLYTLNSNQIQEIFKCTAMEKFKVKITQKLPSDPVTIELVKLKQ